MMNLYYIILYYTRHSKFLKLYQLTNKKHHQRYQDKELVRESKKRKGQQKYEVKGHYKDPLSQKVLPNKAKVIYSLSTNA